MSWLHIKTSLMGAIWREDIWNGSAANDEVSRLETPSILAQIRGCPAKLIPTAVQNKRHGLTQMGHQ
jgi:hypothetical protein